MTVRVNMIQGLISIITVRFLYYLFEGVVAAKLPFEPFKLITGMTHYGIEGESY